MRGLTRRSFLGRVAGLGALGMAAGCATRRTADADSRDPLGGPAPIDPRRELEREAGCTDADTGRYTDEPGRGRRCRPVGETRRRRRRRSDD